MAPSGDLQGDVTQVIPQLASRAVREGKTLVIPPGTWQVGETILVPSGAHLRLAPGAELRGALVGQPLLRLSSGSVLQGGTISNVATQPGFGVDFQAGTIDATIRGVSFTGQSVNAVYLNELGLARITVDHSTFTGVGYGVLLNNGAIDARNLTITENSFTRVGADPIEINAATGGGPQRVRNIRIAGNRMSDFVGEGDSSGLGIGIAGGQNVIVDSNVITGARNEAIHLEDGTTSVVVTRNVIDGGGVGSRPAVAIYRTAREIEVDSNRIRKFEGDGVAVRWDSMGSAIDVSVTGNRISKVSGAGVVLAGDLGTGPFLAKDNILVDCRGGGIAVAGSHALSRVIDNLIKHPGGTAIGLNLRGTGRTVVEGNRIIH